MLMDIKKVKFTWNTMPTIDKKLEKKLNEIKINLKDSECFTQAIRDFTRTEIIPYIRTINREQAIKDYLKYIDNRSMCGGVRADVSDYINKNFNNFKNNLKSCEDYNKCFKKYEAYLIKNKLDANDYITLMNNIILELLEDKLKFKEEYYD